MTPEPSEKYHKDKLRTSDGILLFRCEAPEEWQHAQEQALDQCLASRRDPAVPVARYSALTSGSPAGVRSSSRRPGNGSSSAPVTWTSGICNRSWRPWRGDGTGLMSPAGSAPDRGRVFPGLRPFEEQDAALFFGRDEQVDGLLRRLDNTRFLAVVGLSGSGKSSLVRAGLLPALRRGHLNGAGARWRIAVMRPGSDPLGTLGKTLDDTLGEFEDRPEILRSGSLGLLDASRDGRGPEDNLLLVVDQFEENFRFQREYRERAEDAAAFVDLLLAAVQAYEARYRLYVVITMRSDYLGEAAHFPGLPEALNDSQYLVPRMTREQLREAVLGPAALGGVEVDPSLIDQLLEETGTDPDQLPVLQHLLMRMWEVREELNGASRITVAQLEEVGGWDNALTNHAKAMYDLLDHDRQVLAKRVFQRLTERGEASRESPAAHAARGAGRCERSPRGPGEAVVDHYPPGGMQLPDVARSSIDRRLPDRHQPREPDPSLDGAARVGERGSRIRRVVPSRGGCKPPLSASEERTARGTRAGVSTRLAEEPALECRLGRAVSPKDAEGRTPVGLSLELPEYDRAMAFLESSNRAQRAQRAKRVAVWALLSAFAVSMLILGWNQYRSNQQLAVRSALAQPDPLARALLLAMFANGAGEQDLRDYQAAARAAIPLAVLRPQQEGGLIAATFDRDNPERVVTVSAKGFLRCLSSDGRGGSTALRIGRRATAESSPDSPASPQLKVVAFSPDARRIAVGLDDGSGWVGPSGSSGWLLIPSQGRQVEITALAFSQDGQSVLAGYNDYEVRIWTLPPTNEGSMQPGATLGAALKKNEADAKHKGLISGVSFDPRGGRVATASWDGTTRVWDLGDPSKPIHV